jgi:hypothetical protein
VGVHLAREHALELEAGDFLLQPLGVLLDGGDRAGVVLRLGEIEEFRGFVDTASQAIEGADDALELRALAAELLRALGLTPDPGILEFPQDLRQSLAASFVVKGTP